MDIKSESFLEESQQKLKTGILYTNAYSPSNHETYYFKAPPEAPIYRPTEEEFSQGPLNYINKIRKEAEKYGICRIIPPPSFQPPFTVDVNKFRFTPRVQRLNELEAQTRVRLNFLEHVIKYWDLQGQQLKIPSIDKKILDLYLLHKVVEEEGGFEVCVKDRKWSIVAMKMGFNLIPQNKGTIASLLRHHYEKVLYPYDLFANEAIYNENCVLETDNDFVKNNNNIKQEKDVENINTVLDIDKCNDKGMYNQNQNEDSPKKDNLQKCELEKSDLKLPMRRTSRRMQGKSLCNMAVQNKELERLQVYGPGPKMPGFSLNLEEPSSDSTSTTLFDSNLPKCVQCGNSQNPLISCATCKNNFHFKCLILPLNDYPKGIWNCPRCVAFLVQSQPQSYTQEFGFAQSPRSYSLAEFGEIADQFKLDYFRMPCHLVPLNLAEKEFWRLVSSLEDSVAVEYGADLHTNEFGSGFPTRKNSELFLSDMEYIDHSWNLNNLPVLEGSVFKYINTNISGMIVPWMYVGMCFSTFCWHNEDHWSYSINYLHWGEVKTWYGVPGFEAERFETAMKSVAPELFKSQPDLLHQLVTICNPNILQKKGVPIYSANQHAGDFVITFPRAYHAGFNHGLNFAEAVNFSPADWLPLGRECINYYSTLQRYPVFSHDELVCKMANDPDILDVDIAEATYLDLLKMVEQEKISRENIFHLGILKSVRETFELIPDDERQCDFCKTTCFLSGLSCDCSDCKLVCLKHPNKICNVCKPESFTLRYRYTLDELPLMLDKVKKRKQDYQNWCKKAEIFIKYGEENIINEKVELIELKNLIEEVKTKNYSVNDVYFSKLKELFELACNMSATCKEILNQQKILDKANEQIIKNKQNKNDLGKSLYFKPKKRNDKDDFNLKFKIDKKNKDENNKLEFDEFESFVENINDLPCLLEETESINELYKRCLEIKNSIEEINNFSSNETSNLTSDLIEQLIFGANCISIINYDDCLDKVKCKYMEIKWIEECGTLLHSTEDNRKKKHQIELSFLDNLISSANNLVITTDNAQQYFLELHNLKNSTNEWIQVVKSLIEIPLQTDNDFNLENYSKLPTLEMFENLVKEAENRSDLVKMNLYPYLDKAQKVVTNARAWLLEYDKLFIDTNNDLDTLPFFDKIEELYNSAKELGCKLDQMNKLYSICIIFRTWKEKLRKYFLRKFSIYNLFNILLPRTRHSVPQSLDLVQTSSKVLYQQLKKLYARQTSKDFKKIDWFKKLLEDDLSRNSIEKAYKEAERNEEVCMKEMREKNILKLHKSVTMPESNSQDKLTDFETEEDTCEKYLDNKKKKFCICGKKPSNWMIQCFLCQDWFHVNCLQTYLQTIDSPFAKMKKISLQEGCKSSNGELEIESEKESLYFLCILCSRGKRPNLDSIINLSEQISKQPIRIFENELLRCLIARATIFKANLYKELDKRSDLKNAYEQIIKLQCKEELNIENFNENEFLKPKKKKYINNYLDLNKNINLNINLTDQTKNVLYNLIWEGSLLQVTIEELKLLWKIWIYNDSSIKTAVFISTETGLNLPAFNNYITCKRKLNEDKDKNINLNLNDSILNNNLKKRKIDVKIEGKKEIDKKAKEPKKQKIRKTTNNTLNQTNQNKFRLKKKNTSSSDSESETCVLKESCLKPVNEEVDWIFCDGECQGWYHQLCAGIDATCSVEELDKFYCSKCTNTKDQKKCALNDQCTIPNSDEVDWIFCDGICKNWYHQICLNISTNLNLNEKFYCFKCVNNQSKQNNSLIKHESSSSSNMYQMNIEAAESILSLGREMGGSTSNSNN